MQLQPNVWNKSCRYHNSTKQLLVSSRPNSRTPYARHALCTISNEVDDVLGCNTVHSFNGGGAQKLLSRTTFLSDSDYVAAHHEMNKSVCVYSVNTGSKVSSVPAHDPVLDICDVTSGGTMSLACLTEKKLEFFKLAKWLGVCFKRAGFSMTFLYLFDSELMRLRFCNVLFYSIIRHIAEVLSYEENKSLLIQRSFIFQQKFLWKYWNLSISALNDLNKLEMLQIYTKIVIINQRY